MSDSRPRTGSTSPRAEARARTSRRSAAAAPFARHGRLPVHRTSRTVVKIVAGALGVALVSATSIAAIAVSMVVSESRPTIDLDPVANGQTSTATAAPAISAIEGGVNLLIVGSDSRQGQGDAYGDPTEETGVLNDVNMLLHISEDHSNVSVISFPRDMFVDIPSCVSTTTGDALDEQYDTKINEALGEGGLACVASTVEQLTGVEIPYAAVVQFNGVIEMSNAVGGVNVCVATPIEDEYTNLDLSAGTHELQGAQALAFLRTRHGIGDGSDLTRISNQQVFLSALVRKVKSAETLANPVALYGLARAVVGNMTLSTSLSNVDTLVQIGLALKDVDMKDVVFIQYPTEGVDGGVVPSVDAAAVLNTALQNDQPIVLTGTTGGGATLDPSVAQPETTEPVDPAATDPAVDPSTDPAATAVPTDPGVVALPENVTGQSAAEQTCSVGFFG